MLDVHLKTVVILIREMFRVRLVRVPIPNYFCGVSRSWFSSDFYFLSPWLLEEYVWYSVHVI